MKTYHKFNKQFSINFNATLVILYYEATADKPEQSITALIPMFLGVILFMQ